MLSLSIPVCLSPSPEINTKLTRLCILSGRWEVTGWCGLYLNSAVWTNIIPDFVSVWCEEVSAVCRRPKARVFLSLPTWLAVCFPASASSMATNLIGLVERIK